MDAFLVSVVLSLRKVYLAVHVSQFYALSASQVLAFLGQIVTRGGLHLGGSINLAGNSFDSYPNGVAALIGPDSIPTAGLVQIILFCGWLEIALMKDVPGAGNEF